MRCIIVSDFHLKFYEKAEDIDRRQRVESFLISLINKIDCLILAGDIFDLWMEWNNVIIKNSFSTLKIFAQLKESGCRLIFLSGNHDFWLDKFLKENIGFEIFENFFIGELNGQRIFVSHGDLYTQNDTRYQIFRIVMRSPLSKFFFKILHPEISLAIGKLLSRSGKRRNVNFTIDEAKEKGLIDKAKSLSHEYDLIVFGHTHKPLKMNFGKSIYINCGDWINNSSYCFIDELTIDLLHYKE